MNSKPVSRKAPPFGLVPFARCLELGVACAEASAQIALIQRRVVERFRQGQTFRLTVPERRTLRTAMSTLRQAGTGAERLGKRFST